MALWLETDTNANTNISSPTAVGVRTATRDEFVLPQILADQVAGGGDYVYYVTLQVAGAGTHYVMGPKTTHTAAAGETGIAAQGGMIFMRNGDVLTVYIDGLAGDTTTPDVTVRFAAIPLPSAAAGAIGGLPVLDANLAASANVTYLKDVALTETGAGYLAAGFKKLFDVATPVLTAASVNQTGDSYGVVTHTDYGNAKLVRSTTPANTLDVSAAGQAGVDWANIGSPTTTVALTGTTVGTVTTLTGHTAQTGDSYAIVNHVDYGNAHLVRSTTPANTLDVSSTGEAGLDFANIKQATGATTLTNITVPTVTTTGTASAVTAISTGGITAGSFAAGAIDAAAIAANAIGASELAADAVTEIVAGMGGLDIFIYTLTDGSGNAIEDCLVEAFSDAGMTTIVDYGVTDLYGKVRLNLDSPGTYYLKRTKTDYTFTNPDTETLS